MKLLCDCGNEKSKYAKRCQKCHLLVTNTGNKGKIWSQERKEKHENEKNGMWKGNNVGISSLHSWVKRRLKKPQFCEECGQKTAYDLANKSGLYKRDLTDWIWLCRKCHMESDGRLNNLKRFTTPKKTIEELKETRKRCEKEYRERNKEIINAKKREYYQNNIEKKHEKWKIYYLKNKEKYLRNRRIKYMKNVVSHIHCKNCGFSGKGDIGYDIQGYIVVSCPSCDKVIPNELEIKSR